MLLGCIADDFTGATDLAGTLVKSGMTAVQLIGVPTGDMPPVEGITDAQIEKIVHYVRQLQRANGIF